ncbi:kinetochore CENP-C fungal-like protein [Apiosordaria backusii]|uniref:CENP-C homolog n=1 Tax=Apiosordaria backusii TaxID=314023 RepID=A0AA40EM95_9PEZI|nr:kinetochore CENP-C fungal-like protein [Apiosordaria backusii]
MAPRPSMAARRTTTHQAEHIYELGVVGRKTGVMLPDSGVRDEHGMEPIENLFSSPKKPDDEDEEEESEDGDSGEAPMELTTNMGLGPAALLNGQASRLPASSQNRSPAKSFLNSPAQRNKLLARNTAAVRSSSSPAESRQQSSSQPTISQGAAKRRLDFNSVGKGGPHSLSQPVMGQRGGPLPGRSQVNGRLQSLSQDEQSEAGSEVDEVNNFVEESIAILNGDDDNLPAPPESEEEDSEEEGSMVGDDTMRLSAAQQKKAGGPPKKQEPVRAKAAQAVPKPTKQTKKPTKKPPVQEEPEEESEGGEEEEEDQQPPPPPPKPAASGKRGRPAGKASNKAATPEPAPAPAAARARKRRATAEEEEEPPAEPSPEPQPKKKRTDAGPAAKAKPAKKEKATAAPADKPKKTAGRKRKSSIADPGDVSVVAVSRRPPLPKSRGLLINRREIPGETDSMFRTRSGRNSFKPLAFWRNEQVHYENDDIDDNFASRSKPSKFVLPKIKEVVRVDEPEPEFRKPGRRGPKPKRGSRPGRTRRSSFTDQIMDSEPAEPWEVEPGTVTGEVVVWQPEYEYQPPAPNDMVSVMDKQLAISGHAIKTTEVVGGEFRYAKVFSEGFIGAGVVDLPPGAIKRLKNSRKVFMIFFVHAGKCLVTVQETSFRISKGGIFIVPRYNEYTIENDYDQPTRLFFAQGTEVTSEQEASVMPSGENQGEEEEEEDGGEE